MERSSVKLQSKWLFFVFLLLSAVVSDAQKVFNPRFKAGTVFTKSSDVNSVTGLEAFGQKLEYSITAHIETQYKILSASDSGYEIQITLTAINTELSSNGIKLRFNSEKDSSYSDSIFVKPLSDILGKPSHIFTDTTGTIVKTDTSALQQKAKEYMAGLILTGNDLAVGQKFELLQPVPDEKLQTGTSWSDSTQASQGKRVNRFRIENTTDSSYIIDLSGTVMRSIGLQQNDRNETTVFEGNLKGKLEIYKDKFLIIKRSMNIDMAGETILNGTKVPATSKTAIKEILL